MLLLGSRTITVEGITVYPDHSDPDQFWYLPGPVALNRRKDGQAAFTFIKFKPAAVAGGAKGGGFLMFETALKLTPELERRILSKLRSIARKPRLAAAPFDEGTVQVIALDLQGSGGTASTAAPGTFRAVEKVLGATVPSLAGDNNAAFSLTLSQEGAIILEKAFQQGTEPVGVIYDLKYTGMRPALHVEITAEMERVYNQFAANVEAQVYFVRAGIDAAFEKLVQEGAIKIKVLDFTGEADEKEKEQWALDFFKNNLLTKWFEPTLNPGQIQGGLPKAEDLDAVLKRGTAAKPPLPAAPPKPDTASVAGTVAGAVAGAVKKPPTSPTEGTGQGTQVAQGLNITPPASPGTGSPTEGTGFPPAATPPDGATAAKTPAQKANLPAGLGTPAGGGQAAGTSSPFGVSFKLRAVHQEERKTIKVVYDRSEAVQRTYAPQGFFGLLVADLARDRHFVEVDLDDPFFRAFAVSVEAPFDFERIGLTSAQVALDYGNPADPATLKHGDLVLDRTDKGPKRFEVFMNKRLDTDYQKSVQFHFDPQSGWQASRFSYELPVTRTEDRTLILNPHENLGFLEIQVEPTRVDWEIVDSIDVHIQLGQGDALIEKFLTFTKDTPVQVFRARIEDRNARDYTFDLKHHLKDGTTREQGPFTSRASIIPVDDPFPSALEIDFIPLLDAARTRTAFVDIQYADEPNNYRREERLTLTPAAADPVRKLIALMNPSLKEFKFRVTLVGADNSMRRGPFVATTETLIPISEDSVPVV